MHVCVVEGWSKFKIQSNFVVFRANGGAGALDLAKSVVEATKVGSDFKFLYSLDLPIVKKIEIIARKIYGADGVELSEEARAKSELYTKQVGRSSRSYQLLLVISGLAMW